MNGTLTAPGGILGVRPREETMIFTLIVAVIAVGVALGFWFQRKLREKGQL
jgi:cytochrome oxidase assembly protein ShyY1